MNKITILSESKYDFKYKNIFNSIKSIKVVEGKFVVLLRLMFQKNTIYHIRYIKYRGIFSTIFRLLIIFFVSRISCTKIIWTCHNIFEHNIPSKKVNTIFLRCLSYMSDKIIVFHEDLIEYIPKRFSKKITVSCFGNFKRHFISQTDENSEFSNKLNTWYKDNHSNNFDLLSISAARRNNLKFLIENIKNTELSALIIAPKTKLKSNNKNILIYNNYVSKEINQILSNNINSIGFIGHDNISVPTSIYMYASYGIPIIALDYKPVSSIIKNYNLGHIVDETNIEECIKKIKINYKDYQKNLSIFLEKNTWELATKTHQEMLGKL